MFVSARAFAWLKLSGLYPPELRSVNLDVEWGYRRLLPATAGGIARIGTLARTRLLDRLTTHASQFPDGIYRHHGPQGVFARTWPTGSTVLWVALLLGAFLVLYYL